MFRGNLLPLISACSVGIGAYLGAKYERYIQNQGSDFMSYFPCSMPVYAAVPANIPDNIGNRGVAPNSSASEIMKFGFPSLDNIRSFDDYVLAYDRRNRNAQWVFEHLTPDKLPSNKNSKVDRSKSNFFEDDKVHLKFRSFLKDYKNSGFDRGHLAAAGNHRHSQTSLDQTFSLSNISPQVGDGFNRGIWNNLEQYVRSIARNNKNTYICTGPLYLPKKESDGKLYVKYEVIGQNHVAVPTHFFKVLAVESYSGDFELLSFVLPNQYLDSNIPLKSFHMPIDAIERGAGFLLFDKLPKNRIRRVNGKNV